MMDFGIRSGWVVNAKPGLLWRVRKISSNRDAIQGAP